VADQSRTESEARAKAEAVKPLQNIGDVKIIDMGGGLPRGVNGVASSGGRMDTLVDSLLAYRANAPVIDQLLTEAGFPNSGGVVSTLLGTASGPKAARTPPAPDGHAPDGHAPDGHAPAGE
jgi:uncharacterized membrane protein YqiK